MKFGSRVKEKKKRKKKGEKLVAKTGDIMAAITA